MHLMSKPQEMCEGWLVAESAVQNGGVCGVQIGWLLRVLSRSAECVHSDCFMCLMSLPRRERWLVDESDVQNEGVHVYRSG